MEKYGELVIEDRIAKHFHVIAKNNVQIYVVTKSWVQLEHFYF